MDSKESDSALNNVLIEMKADQAESSLPAFKRIAEIVSKKQKAYFDALIDSGFEEHQALNLVGDSELDRDLHILFNSNEDMQM